MATAVGNLERRRPEGLIQAMHRSNVRDGQRGDAYLVPASKFESTQPGVMSTSLMSMPAVNHDVAYGVLEQRSSDIYSFLAGTRPRTLEQPQVDFSGLSGYRSANIEDPTMFQSSAPCRGAALGAIPKRNLLRAAENELLPFQTRTALP